MKYRLRLFGVTVAELDIEPDEVEYVEEPVGPEGIVSGSMQNFERDCNPVSPDDRYAPYEDRFGFA